MLIASRGAVIFGALALYCAHKHIFDFHSTEGELWTPKVATALSIVVGTACAAPFLLKLSRGTGSLVLRLRCEMIGWSWWIGAFEETFSGMHDTGERVHAIVTFLGIFLAVAPVYLLSWWFLRLSAYASPRLQQKMSKLDQEVVDCVRLRVFTTCFLWQDGWRSALWWNGYGQLCIRSFHHSVVHRL